MDRTARSKNDRLPKLAVSAACLIWLPDAETGLDAKTTPSLLRSIGRAVSTLVLITMSANRQGTSKYKVIVA